MKAFSRHSSVPKAVTLVPPLIDDREQGMDLIAIAWHAVRHPNGRRETASPSFERHSVPLLHQYMLPDIRMTAIRTLVKIYPVSKSGFGPRRSFLNYIVKQSSDSVVPTFRRTFTDSIRRCLFRLSKSSSRTSFSQSMA